MDGIWMNTGKCIFEGKVNFRFSLPGRQWFYVFSLVLLICMDTHTHTHKLVYLT